MSGKSDRLDHLLVSKGFFPSREKARAAIMAGRVLVNGRPEDKPGSLVERGAEIGVTGEEPYVSRGGQKLEKAIKTFGIDLKNKTALDIGAGSGGFTDCVLQNGAKKVYAVDVGYGQLAWKLRCDPRVVVLERSNFRHLAPHALGGEPVDFFMIDVSFISLAKIIPRLYVFASHNATGVALIKPQFEAGRDRVGKKGVVRDAEIHKEVIVSVCRSFSEAGWVAAGLDYSPVKGPEGNIEFLLYFTSQDTMSSFDPVHAACEIVERAHAELSGSVSR